MARVKEYFVPEEKGKYWRNLVNCVRDLPPDSVHIPSKLISCHPKDQHGELVLPYGGRTWTTYVGRGLSQEDDAELGCRLYEVFSSEIEMAFSIFLQLLGGIPQPRKVGEEVLAEVKMMRDHLEQVGKDQDIGEDDFSRACRDYWFCYGYESLRLGGYEEFLAIFLALCEPDHVVSVLGTDFSEVLEWKATEQRIQSVHKLVPEVTEDVAFWQLRLEMLDYLLYALPGISCLGEFELLRRNAHQVWGGNPTEARLELPFVLTLRKYLRLTSLVIDVKHGVGGFVEVSILQEQRQSQLPHLYSISGARTTSVAEHSWLQPMAYVTFNAYIDFWDELNQFIRYESYKGSIACIECGSFIPRTFDAYGQKYCSPQCKKRAAKRRAFQKKRLNGRVIG